MGIAAYYRGNKLISLQLNRAAGIPDPCFVTERRPAGWGLKAQGKALDCAVRILEGRQRYGMVAPTEEILAMAVKESARVGVETARNAARLALEAA